MKSQDIVILLKLISIQEQQKDNNGSSVMPPEQPYSVRSLGAQLGISKSEISQSLKRSISSGIALKPVDGDTPRPHRKNLFNFIVHGLRFVFPAELGSLQRGVPTAFAAPMLQSQLVSAGNYSYVWPTAMGQVMGQSVNPLFKSVPEAALSDARLYEYLALVDAIRLGNQRESSLAIELLKSGLLHK